MSDVADPASDAGEPTVRVGLADAVCGSGLALGIIAAYVFLVITPSLLAHHAVLLEALTGSKASIITGGAFARVGRASLAVVILAPLCSVLLYDVFYWWAGQLWGERVMARYLESRPRAARWVDRTERWVRRRGLVTLAAAYYLPVPNVLIFLSCGVSGMPLWMFLLGDVIGTLLWEALLVSLGWAIGHPAVHVVNVISKYSLWVTVALLVVVIAVSVVRQRRLWQSVEPPAAD